MRPDRRWLYAALAISLLANLFLGGLILGHSLAHVARPASGALAPATRLRALPSDERARFARVMRSHRPAIRAARLALKAARARVEADIAQPAYDPVQTASDLAAMRAAAMASQVQTQGALAQALTQLSPASRAALVASPLFSPAPDGRREGDGRRVGNEPSAR